MILYDMLEYYQNLNVQKENTIKDSTKHQNTINWFDWMRSLHTTQTLAGCHHSW